MKCDSFERFVDYHNLLQSHVTCKAVLEFPSLSFESRISMSSAKSSAGVGGQYRRAYDFIAFYGLFITIAPEIVSCVCWRNQSHEVIPSGEEFAHPSERNGKKAGVSRLFFFVATQNRQMARGVSRLAYDFSCVDLLLKSSNT